MSENLVNKDNSIDVNSLFKNITKSETVSSKSPLDDLKEKQGQGMSIVNVDNDTAPIYTGSVPMNSARSEDIKKKMDELDELAEKAKLVSITSVPKDQFEFVEMIDQLDNLDVNELKKINDLNSNNNVKTINSDDLEGVDISSSTIITDSNNSTDVLSNSNLFISKEESNKIKAQQYIIESENTKNTNEDDQSATVIVKDATRNETVGNSDITYSIVEFTDDEHEKLTRSKRIDLVMVDKQNIDVAKIKRPSETFLANYTSHMYNAMAGSSTMTLVASRFRINVRGLTFGEYLDLSLSTELTDVDVINKKCSIFYKAIINTSIGNFVSYDEFLKNLAYFDVPLCTLALYISTNPEKLELGLTCGNKQCNTKFNIGFSPRNILGIKNLSEYYLENMEKIGNADGEIAQKLHEESTVITKKIFYLPITKIGIEFGLKSCYEMINSIFPYVKEVEEKAKEEHQDDVNKITDIISYLFKFISAIYLPDDESDEHDGKELTMRVDDMHSMVEILYALPISDFMLIQQIADITERDYILTFGVSDIVCPNCGAKTEFVQINLDEEVFTRLQEQGNIQINPETLPRL